MKTPDSIENPERDLELTNRDPRGSKRVVGAIEHVKNGTRPEAEEELQALRARIATAKTLQPTAEARHCLDCFQKGRDAAIRAIEDAT